MIHIVMFVLITFFILQAVAIKKYHWFKMIPKAERYKEEIGIQMISDTMGNLYIVIASVLIFCEVIEAFVPGSIRIMIWISVIPIVIYVRIAMNKIMK